MKHLKTLLIPILGATIVIMWLLWPPSPAKAQPKAKHGKDVYCEYTPQDYHMNYGIDLKPDGYLINKDGEIYYVPFDELEDWFIEDNM